MIPLLVKFVGSLAGVLVLVGIARALGLGGDVRIRDADHARLLAQDVVYGFEPVDVIVDRAGFGALLKDSQGRQMLIRRGGAHFAGHLLEPGLDARLDHHMLTLGSSASLFGATTLNLGEAAQQWAAGLRHLHSGSGLGGSVHGG
jgi:hypothetical protein